MTTGPGQDEIVRPRVFNEEELDGARAYAEAFLNAAEKDGQVEEALGEIGEIRVDILERHPEFAHLLASNSLSAERRDEILADALGGRALPVVERFLRVVARHGRFDLVGLIHDQAVEMLDRRRNRRPVLVRSAVPLDPDQVDVIKARLVGLLGGATPVLKVEVDPSLIGGLVIQSGDHLYDLSVQNRLHQLRNQLVETKAAEFRGRSAAFLTA